MEKIMQISTAIAHDVHSDRDIARTVCVTDAGRAYELAGSRSVGNQHWVALPPLPEESKPAQTPRCQHMNGKFQCMLSRGHAGEHDDGGPA